MISAHATSDCRCGTIFFIALSSKLSKEAHVAQGSLWIPQMAGTKDKHFAIIDESDSQLIGLIVVATLARAGQITVFDSNPLQFRRERDDAARDPGQFSGIAS